MAAGQIELKKFIRDIPDWPKKGILFKDITPLLYQSQLIRADSIQGNKHKFESSSC